MSSVLFASYSRPDEGRLTCSSQDRLLSKFLQTTGGWGVGWDLIGFGHVTAFSVLENTKGKKRHDKYVAEMDGDGHWSRRKDL